MERAVGDLRCPWGCERNGDHRIAVLCSHLPASDREPRTRYRVGTAMSASSRRKPEIHLPGESGIWVFITGDMLIFSVLFCTFLFYRADAVELFSTSQQTLNTTLGTINTILLLTSSWFVARAVHKARSQSIGGISSLLLAAFVCGLGFAVLKIIEYREKVMAGLTLTTNDFYMYYYVLTGLHFVHLLLGMAFLTYLWNKSQTSSWGRKDLMTLESGASFWHLVDMLWIILFPLIYLIR